jgi:PAS domain S-box-containing protein
VSDLVVNLDYQSLVEDAHEVLRTLVFAERDVQTTDGEWRQMRILPYRTANNVIDGLIITVTDIQRLKEAQRELQEARTIFEDLLANLPAALVLLDKDFKIIHASTEFARRFGATEPHLLGRALTDLAPGWRHAVVEERLAALSRGEPCPQFRVQGNLGSTFLVDLVIHPRRLRRVHPAVQYLFLLQEVTNQLPAAVNLD